MRIDLQHQRVDRRVGVERDGAQYGPVGDSFDVFVGADVHVHRVAQDRLSGAQQQPEQDAESEVLGNLG